MLQFTPTSEGTTALNNAVAGTSPVLIDAIVLNLSGGTTKTISEFSGSVYKDDCGIGEYCKICFEDTSATSYTISSFTLKSGGTVIANSDTVAVVKEANRILKVEISCQFTGAYKCGFNTYEIALPHATKFREGVIRIARSIEESQKEYTVYNASTIDEIIEDISDIVTGDLVPWKQNAGSPVTGTLQADHIEVVNSYSNPTQTVTISTNGQTSGVTNLSVDGYVTGTAVSSSPTISSGSITGSPKLVNETYLSSLYANEVSTANNTKLVTSNAVSTYVQSQLENIDDDYVHIEGAEIITGAKTFTGGIVANSTISGSGVQSSKTNWNASANYSKLPTVEVVDNALSTLNTNITEAYQNADSDLQEQIDALNAGQNLADIVDLIGDLKSHSIANLQPKEGADTVGDKIQVLHDKTDSSGTVVPSADGVATVYELVHGTIDRTTYPKDQPSDTSGYYWHYIGEYGCDSYSKSESDTKYVIKANLDQSIASTSSTTNAPSTKAVYNAIDALSDSVEDNYVKLVSNSAQTIESELIIDTGSHSVSLTDNTFASNSYYDFIAGNTSGSTFVQVKLESTYGHFIVYLGSSDKAFSIESSNGTPNVIGTHVASYQDVPEGELTDGRLVTVDYLNSFTGDMAAYAKLAANNTFTGTTNTFNGVSATSYTGTGVYSTYNSSTWANTSNNSKIPTLGTVRSAIQDAQKNVLDTLSTTNEIGSIGLFVYSEVGAEKGYGSTVNGAYLKPVGMSLPMSGQISYKAVASQPSMSGTWKLLSVAFKRTTTEPCLVLAQKISNT